MCAESWLLVIIAVTVCLITVMLLGASVGWMVGLLGGIYMLVLTVAWSSAPLTRYEWRELGGRGTGREDTGRGEYEE